MVGFDSDVAQGFIDVVDMTKFRFGMFFENGVRSIDGNSVPNVF